MIRHIFKYIWNERKINAWIVLEYLVVFCVLWFCCDFLYYTGKYYIEDTGFDIDHTYQIRMGKKDIETDEEIDRQAIAEEFADRVRHYPGVENLSFSYAAVPYINSHNYNAYKINEDTVWTIVKQKSVSKNFFDVYGMKLSKGRPLEDNDLVEGNSVVISPRRNGMLGEFNSQEYDANEIEKIVITKGDNKFEWKVTGMYGKTKSKFFEDYQSTVYEPRKDEYFELSRAQISIRVSPEADRDFAGKFVAEMREQLFIGPYFLVSVSPTEQLKKLSVQTYVADNLNSVLAVTGFLMVNIFLGLIGTFWSRTQSRRSEIGLRIALGSSKRKLQWMMFTEMLIMLFLTSIVATYICMNLAETEILSSLGIPLAVRSQAGIGNWQDVVNYLTTFAFLAVVSGLAVWYPARQSANIPPAEALRDE